MINLISDTVTKPTPSMLEYMMKAHVGDDVFGADPTINALQDKMASMFGKEAALFCPSGTMCNQIAIKLHTNPLDEVICDKDSHVYQYETGGYAFHSGVTMQLVDGSNGKITKEQIASAIRPDYDWLPSSALVVLENSCNKGGGSFYTNEEIEPISKYCKSQGLKLHLDGARLFNVLVESNDTPLDIGNQFDSISICLSKGLGAPVGSVLIGTNAFIKKARRFRKVMGGGMRQAGFLAAAGIYALDHNVDRLKDDNNHAKELGAHLETLDYVSMVRPVKTNIVIFDLNNSTTADQLLEKLLTANIQASAFGPTTVRFVTHMEITPEMIQEVKEKLSSIRF